VKDQADRKVRTANRSSQRNPGHHASIVASYSTASPEHVQTAIEAALAAKPAWESMPFCERAAIFLKAADLIATKYRHDLIAATMLGQGKNAWQAEIDAAAELVDFLRFSVAYAEQVYAEQPRHNSAGVWNRVEYRALEGFVYAVTPFNFTAIAGNLACAPALMGNVVVWKPADAAMASSYLLYRVLLEAGLPPSVVQFVPGPPAEVTRVVLAHRRLAALHFTGSTAVFRQLYGHIGRGVEQARYAAYPRIVGETGGKNFHLVHASADVPSAVANTLRAAFEYQGQKCSAASRLYVPASLWPAFRAQLVAQTEALRLGPVDAFENVVGPVIDAAAFARLRRTIDAAQHDDDLTLLAGGRHDDSTGYYVHPTIYQARTPHHPLLATELFGPVLAAYVYDDAAPHAWRDICAHVDAHSPYALTGALFAVDRAAIVQAAAALRHAAGNFYVNAKCTGAVVGQQPFGGARASGTNDKAGSAALLARFVSARCLKEDFLPLAAVAYPSNEV
jgi:1-pyrroline-5-carboxylate dehydrogenase